MIRVKENLAQVVKHAEAGHADLEEGEELATRVADELLFAHELKVVLALVARLGLVTNEVLNLVARVGFLGGREALGLGQGHKEKWAESGDFHAHRVAVRIGAKEVNDHLTVGRIATAAAVHVLLIEILNFHCVLGCSDDLLVTSNRIKDVDRF